LNILIDRCTEGLEATNIKEKAGYWLAFCFYEYRLYYRYDQFTITVAAIFITFYNEGMNQSIQVLRELLGMTVDFSVIARCVNEMFIRVYEQDALEEYIL
jgi:hypothetical protein